VHYGQAFGPNAIGVAPAVDQETRRLDALDCGQLLGRGLQLSPQAQPVRNEAQDAQPESAHSRDRRRQNGRPVHYPGPIRRPTARAAAMPARLISSISCGLVTGPDILRDPGRIVMLTPPFTPPERAQSGMPSAWAGNGKSGFDNIDAQFFKLQGDADFIVQIHGCARRLFAVT
jgi:hypothetical protein